MLNSQDSSAAVIPERQLKIAKMAICFTVFIDMIGVGLILPVIPALLEEISNTSIPNAAKIGGWLLFIYATFQFIAAPIAGRLSDLYGRKPVLVFALFGLVIDYTVMYFATTISVLFFARAVSGVLGSTFPVATAFMADVSSEDTRTTNFGYVEAAAGVGLIFGPAIGGLLGDYDARLPFMAAAVLTFANLISVLLFVPETNRRREGEGASLHTKSSAKFWTHSWFKIALPAITFFFVFELAAQALPSVWPFFATEKLAWSPFSVGLAIAIFGFMVAIVQGVLLKHFISVLGDARTVYFGICASAFGYFGLAFSSNHFSVILFMSIIAIGTVVFPTSKSVASNVVHKSDQGKLQGVLASATSLSIILGAVLMTQTFSAFSKIQAANSIPVYLPGAPFILSAALFVLTLMFSRKFSKLCQISLEHRND